MPDTYEELTAPERMPEPGFYYHYKHDPNGEVTNYAYEILGVGLHTEDDCRPEDQFMQVYRPLYTSAKVYQMGKMFDLRPLAMAMDEVEKDGYKGPRFIKITDPEVIEKLKEIRNEMYPQN
jgi:hypothetical protein